MEQKSQGDLCVSFDLILAFVTQAWFLIKGKTNQPTNKKKNNLSLVGHDARWRSESYCTTTLYRVLQWKEYNTCWYILVVVLFSTSSLLTHTFLPSPCYCVLKNELWHLFFSLLFIPYLALGQVKTHIVWQSNHTATTMQREKQFLAVGLSETNEACRVTGL